MSLHEFKWTAVDVGDCGSHGCSGHTDYTVICKCGWTKKYKGEYFGRPKEEDIMLQHRLDYLENNVYLTCIRPSVIINK